MTLSTVLLTLAPLAGQAADWYTTRRFLSAAAREVNPLLKNIVTKPTVWIAVKAAIGVWLSYVVWSLFAANAPLAVFTSVVFSLLGFGPAGWNLYQWYKSRK